jgi:hypothetical protein
MTQKETPQELRGGGHLERLGSPRAFDDAHNAPAARILRDLRNGLAHGGVAYLNASGDQTESDAAMLAFAGTVLRNRRLVGLNILRVAEEDFYDFLIAWGDWLSSPLIRQVLNRMGPLAA